MFMMYCPNSKEHHIDYNNFFTACMFAMSFSEVFDRADVVSNETGEVLRTYRGGYVTYMAPDYN